MAWRKEYRVRLARLTRHPARIGKMGVCLVKELDNFPAPTAPDGVQVKEMEMSSAEDIAIWVELVSQAYTDWNASVEGYEKRILRARDMEIFGTYWAVSEGGTPLGSISVGFYKNDPAKAGVKRTGCAPPADPPGALTGGQVYPLPE